MSSLFGGIVGGATTHYMPGKLGPVGPQGETGMDGEQGPEGPPGPPGADGADANVDQVLVKDRWSCPDGTYASSTVYVFTLQPLWFTGSIPPSTTPLTVCS